MSIFTATDPDARAMEARMRFPGYTVERARRGLGKRWIIRHQNGYVTTRGAVGIHVGAMRGYATEVRAWEIVRAFIEGMQP